MIGSPDYKTSTPGSNPGGASIFPAKRESDRRGQLKKRLLRAFLVAAALLIDDVCFAQQPDANASQAASVERVRAAVVQQQVVADGTGIVFAPKPEDFRLGVLTFVPPGTAGGIVAIRVPIGEMISGAAHSIAALQHRRAERAAHAEVVKALAAFQKSQQQ